jgi:hypothetical protein
MKKFVTAAFWDYAGERALKTAVQALFAGGLIGAGLFDLAWLEVASVAGGTAVASVLTSILMFKGDGEDDPNDTSIG